MQEKLNKNKYNIYALLSTVLILLSIIFKKSLSVGQGQTLLLVSFIFGIIALKQIKKTKQKGKIFAIIPMLMFGSVILGLIILAVYYFSLSFK